MEKSKSKQKDKVHRRNDVKSRVLVAGIGNVLRGDDGFGHAVVQALQEGQQLPSNVNITELGIGGVSLVHELMDGYKALILVDAADRSAKPGSVFTMALSVPDIASISPGERRAVAADMHQAVPSRALIMAQAAGVLPSVVHMIGCQPGETETFSTQLSLSVQAAVPRAVTAVLTIVKGLNKP